MSKSPSQLAAYSDLFERLLDPTFLLNKETYVVVDANNSAERALEIPLDQIKGKPFLEWIPEDLKVEAEKALRIARRRYYPRQFDSSLVTPKKKVILMEMVACMLRLSDETDVIQVIAKDVTRVREAEQKADRYLVELQQANAKLEALSITDEMTGLSNFRHFTNELQKEHDRSFRYGTPYALVFCDVDHFKHYNDKNGHQAGDEALRLLAKVIRSKCRNTDLPARYGGEEFAILCPGVSRESASVLAERLRSAVEATPFPFGEKQPAGKVTVSVGVASFPADGQTAVEIVKAADSAAYASKGAGRNRVTLSCEITSTPKLKKAG